jgi:hypothetical protein
VFTPTRIDRVEYETERTEHCGWGFDSHPAQLLHLLLVLIRQPLQQLFGDVGLELERGAKLPPQSPSVTFRPTCPGWGRGTPDNERAHTIGVMSSSSNSAPNSTSPLTPQPRRDGGR